MSYSWKQSKQLGASSRPRALPIQSLMKMKSRGTASRKVFDLIWDEWIGHASWPETKVIHHKISRQEVRGLLLPLNRGYVMEEQAGMGSIYKLGVLGAMCSSHGDHLFDLALGFLEHCRGLFQADPRHKKVTNEDFAKASRLTKEDNALLGRLLSGDLMAWILKINGGGQPDYSTWEYSLPQDIDRIAESKDLRSLLEQRIADSDRPGESVFLDERFAAIVRPLSIDPLNEYGSTDVAVMTKQPDSRRYQVFVSSTYEDLKRERQAVMLALLESKCIPAGMELFPAASVKQWELIKRVIDESDYYLVLVGGRYGSIPARSVKKTSYTEREFNYAAKRGKPILGFYHGNPDRLSSKRREKTAIGLKRLEQFRTKIKNLPCRHWNSPTDLGSAVKTAIAYAIEHNPQPGWVRGGSLSNRGGKPSGRAQEAPLDPLLPLSTPVRAQAKKLLELIWASENQRIANSQLPELLNSPAAKAHLLRDKLYNLGLANNATNFEKAEDFWIVLTDKGWNYVNDSKKEASNARLTVACGESILPPTIGRNKNAFNSLTGAVAATADLFGFSLVNSGRGIIVKCRAVLTAVEKEGVVLCSDSGALPFEPLNAGPDLEVVDLHPGFNQRVTVCSIQDDGSVHAGSFGMLWRHGKFPEYFTTEGDYTLRVTVSAENHDPLYLDFTLHKGNSRADSSIELKSSSTTSES